MATTSPTVAREILSFATSAHVCIHRSPRSYPAKAERRFFVCVARCSIMSGSAPSSRASVMNVARIS
jgi:hypothetical protein